MVAIKLESAKTTHPQLYYEYKIYKQLANGKGIPNAIWYGNEATYHILIMQLLGPSLEDLFNYCKRRFSVKTVCQLADQMIERLECVHNGTFIHRDMKPDNFIIGIGAESTTVFIIDFGLSKRYCDPKTGEHIPYRENKHLTGTPRYASIHNHSGIEQSRRDDLESLCLILIYFLRGNLPWMGMNAKVYF